MNTQRERGGASSKSFFIRAVAAMGRGPGARAASGLFCDLLRLLPAAGGEGKQTADISFSSAEPGSVRFSVNDSACRGALGPFMEKRAAGLKAGYDLRAAAEFLKLGKELRGGYQTTAAVDWPAGGGSPLLKLYLEEAPGLAAAFADRNFRGRLLALAGLGAGAKPARAPGIAGLDLLPGGGTDLKLYFRRNALPGKGPGGPPRAAIRLLDRETRCFYYEMRRLLSGGVKLYKVYESGCGGMPSAALAEICSLYSKLRMPRGVDFVSLYLKMAARAGMRMLPTLCGAGLSAAGKLKIDAYFRFVPEK